MTTYFLILPNDLLLELSLYFNYRDTIVFCQFLRCDEVNFWLNKIQKELGYSSEFIQEYVYDRSHNISKTLLPINEKYIELKTRKSVDFGSEFYRDLTVLSSRSSRLPDFREADELTHYFLHILEKLYNGQDAPFAYYQAIQNALGINNIKLADDLLKEIPSEILKRLRWEVQDYKKRIVTTATFEQYPESNEKFFEKYNIDNTKLRREDIVRGWANGGHLEQMKKHKVSAHELTGNLLYKHKNVIDYYNLIPLGLVYIIENGDINLLSDSEKSLSLIHLIRFGYLEEVQRFSSLIAPIVIQYSIEDCIKYNHIDTLNYLYTKHRTEVESRIRDMFQRVPIMIVYMSDVTLNYLHKHNLVSSQKLREIISSRNDIKANMSVYNMDALRFIEKLA